MNISLTLHGQAVRAALAALQERTANLTPVMRSIGMYYEGRVAENFRNQTDPAGNKWQPLASWTIVRGLLARKGIKKSGDLSKRGKTYLAGKRILWEHGDLAGAVHHQAGPTSVIIGVGGHIPYAAIHQFGGQAGRGKKVTIPARPYLAMNRWGFLELAERDRDRIVGIVQTHIMGRK